MNAGLQRVEMSACSYRSEYVRTFFRSEGNLNHPPQPDDWYLEKFGVHVIDIGRTFDTEAAGWYDIKGHVYRGQYPSGFRPELNARGEWEARGDLTPEDALEKMNKLYLESLRENPTIERL